MPFALNESTEFINPTKALEYMATGRMIVSSAVPDVVSNFGEVVKIAREQDEFIALCRNARNQRRNHKNDSCHYARSWTRKAFVRP